MYAQQLYEKHLIAEVQIEALDMLLFMLVNQILRQLNIKLHILVITEQLQQSNKR